MTSTANNFYGSKFEETKDLDVKDVAKLIRAEIKAIKKAGVYLPKALKVSVKISRYSGGQSLDIVIKGVPFKVLRQEFLAHVTNNPYASLQGVERYTPQAKAVMATLTEIMESYNRDQSDTISDYFSVKFYGDVNFCYEVTNAEHKAFEA
jgi:hypothetical protein